MFKYKCANRIWYEFALLFGAEVCQSCDEIIVAGFISGDEFRCYNCLPDGGQYLKKRHDGKYDVMTADGQKWTGQIVSA